MFGLGMLEATAQATVAAIGVGGSIYGVASAEGTAGYVFAGIGLALSAASFAAHGESEAAAKPKSQSGRGRPAVDSNLSPAERQAGFDQGLASARADGLPNSFGVGFENEFAVGLQNADGTIDLGSIQTFEAQADARTFAGIVDGVELGGVTPIGRGPATIYAGGIGRSFGVHTSPFRFRTVDFGSVAAGTKFVINHEFQHFRGVGAGPRGESRADVLACAAVGCP